MFCPFNHLEVDAKSTIQRRTYHTPFTPFPEHPPCTARFFMPEKIPFQPHTIITSSSYLLSSLFLSSVIIIIVVSVFCRFLPSSPGGYVSVQSSSSSLSPSSSSSLSLSPSSSSSSSSSSPSLLSLSFYIYPVSYSHDIVQYYKYIFTRLYVHRIFHPYCYSLSLFFFSTAC